MTALRSFSVSWSALIRWTSLSAIEEICLKPGPSPPPVVGFAIPAASPMTITRSLNGLRIIPDGTGPQ